MTQSFCRVYVSVEENWQEQQFSLYISFPFLLFFKSKAKRENELGKEIVGSSGILEMEETGLRGKGEKQSRVPVV